MPLRGRSPSRVGTKDAARAKEAAKRDGPRRALRGALDVPRLLALGAALQATMLTYGMLQEHLTSSRAREAAPLPPALLVCTNRLGCAAVAWLVLRCTRAQSRGVNGGSALPRLAAEERALWRKALLSAAAATTDGVLRYTALAIIPFTSFLVLRGAGVFPSLLFGWILHAAPTPRDIFLACSVAAGVLVYGYGDDESDATRSSVALPSLALACGAITANAFNAQWQASIFRHHSLSALELMYRTSCASAVLALALLAARGEALSSLATLRDEPRWLLPVVAMALAAACGTVVVFEVLQRYGGFALSVMQIVRSLLSVALSAAVFSRDGDHAMGVRSRDPCVRCLVLSRLILFPRRYSRGSAAQASR
jgi:hypothetical protein